MDSINYEAPEYVIFSSVYVDSDGSSVEFDSRQGL